MNAADGAVGFEIFLYLNRAFIQERQEPIENAFHEAGDSNRYAWPVPKSLGSKEARRLTLDSRYGLIHIREKVLYRHWGSRLRGGR